MEKLVDIIIPAYNAHNTIDDTLQSIARQTMVDNLRVTIINDCSKKDYKDIVKKYEEILDIHEIDHEANKGCGASRNTGLENAICPYIMFIDSDDLLKEENSVEILYKNISSDDNLHAVYAPITQIEDNKVNYVFPSKHFIWIFGSIFNRDFIEKYNIRFSNTSSGEDAGFNKKVKLLSTPEQIKFINDQVYLWTDNNRENRINTDEFVKLEGRLGYARNIIFSYQFLKTKKDDIPASFDELKLDYLANVMSIYFNYVKMEGYEEKKGYQLLDIFREYYLEYAPIYNNSLTLNDYEIIYMNNYYNNFNSERMPLDAITFDEFTDLLAQDKVPSLRIEKRKTPILSVIIPTYNAENTIDRLINSIIIQGWNKERYEIIISNDHSTDNTLSAIQKYCKHCNISIHDTLSRNIHCPGNTRRDGLRHANGNWITFIDNDDMFELDAFNSLESISNDNPNLPVIFTNFKEYNIEESKVIENQYNKNNFLHGKFYNRNFLIHHRIDFKENLQSNEDLYFNNQVISALIENGIEPVYFDFNSYLWIYNENSLSRKGYNENNCYIEYHFKDFLETSEPLIQNYFYYTNKEYNMFKIMETLLKGYFFYQSTLYKKGGCELTRDNYSYLCEFIKYIKRTFNMNNDDIINYVYSRPYWYRDIKKECIDNSYIFVEITSFMDMIHHMEE